MGSVRRAVEELSTGVVQLSEALEKVIDSQVAAGRAATSSAFLEEAVMRLVIEAEIEEAEAVRVVQSGIADIDAGPFSMIATSDDGRVLREGLMERVRRRLAAGEQWLVTFLLTVPSVSL